VALRLGAPGNYRVRIDDAALLTKAKLPPEQVSIIVAGCHILQVSKRSVTLVIVVEDHQKDDEDRRPNRQERPPMMPLSAPSYASHFAY